MQRRPDLKLGLRAQGSDYLSCRAIPVSTWLDGYLFGASAALGPDELDTPIGVIAFENAHVLSTAAGEHQNVALLQATPRPSRLDGRHNIKVLSCICSG